VCDPNPTIQKKLAGYSGTCTGRDKAPLDPEDRDGFQDGDGKPDPDNDGDKVCDPNPTIQGKLAAYSGVCSGKDVAPLDPEDLDGFQDGDGKPDPDNDGDGSCDPNPVIQKNLSRYKGICSWRDLCPGQAEDKDKFEDTDGCPDPDNDLDGVCDDNSSIQKRRTSFKSYCLGVDRCPNRQETINGNADDDGCPDKGAAKIKISRNKIEVVDRVRFQRRKVKIHRKSKAILRLLAITLVRNPWIKKIRIEGHTSVRDSGEKFLFLSLKWAQALKKFLVAEGVSADRIAVMGFGGSRPIEANCAAHRNRNLRRRCRAKNERIDFVLVEAGIPKRDRVNTPHVLEGLWD
jgi:outer membrane protein OmpA-like peptidoglycan-associated protein